MKIIITIEQAMDGGLLICSENEHDNTLTEEEFKMGNHILDAVQDACTKINCYKIITASGESGEKLKDIFRNKLDN